MHQQYQNTSNNNSTRVQDMLQHATALTICRMQIRTASCGSVKHECQVSNIDSYQTDSSKHQTHRVIDMA